MQKESVPTRNEQKHGSNGKRSMHVGRCEGDRDQVPVLDDAVHASVRADPSTPAGGLTGDISMLVLASPDESSA